MTRGPDFAAPVVGWRTWRVAETAAGVRLWSVIYDETWEPGRAFRARCLRSRGIHGAPDAACGCGIYASRAPGTATRYLVGRNDAMILQRVVGLVALWGHVYEGEAGWRAEAAYPLCLYVPDSGCAAEVRARLARYCARIELLRARSAADVDAALAATVAFAN